MCVTFTDPPLADIQVNFRDGGSGENAVSRSIDVSPAFGTTADTPRRHPGDGLGHVA